MTDRADFVLIIWSSTLPGPTKCSCPVISLRFWGRTRSASGVELLSFMIIFKPVYDEIRLNLYKIQDC